MELFRLTLVINLNNIMCIIINTKLPLYINYLDNIYHILNRNSLLFNIIIHKT
jgi:hypothetical protein